MNGYRDISQKVDFGPILGSFSAKKGLKTGQFFEIVRNVYYIRILHPQISLHGNFQVSSTIFQIWTF